jgi:hypothetical protein
MENKRKGKVVTVHNIQKVPKNWWKDNSIEIWAKDMNRKCRGRGKQMAKMC